MIHIHLLANPTANRRTDSLHDSISLYSFCLSQLCFADIRQNEGIIRKLRHNITAKCIAVLFIWFIMSHKAGYAFKTGVLWIKEMQNGIGRPGKDRLKIMKSNSNTQAIQGAPIKTMPYKNLCLSEPLVRI